MNGGISGKTLVCNMCECLGCISLPHLPPPFMLQDHGNCELAKQAAGDLMGPNVFLWWGCREEPGNGTDLKQKNICISSYPCFHCWGQGSLALQQQQKQLHSNESISVDRTRFLGMSTTYNTSTVTRGFEKKKHSLALQRQPLIENIFSINLSFWNAT